MSDNWKRILGEIRRRENVDLYLYALFSIIAGVLGVVGWVSLEIIGAIILLMLGALASIFLTSRRSEAEIKKVTDQLSRQLAIVRKESHDDKAYESQVDLYRDLAKYIEKYEAKHTIHAIVVQYSARKVDDPLRELMRKGANIKLYIHNQETSISQYQNERIRITLNSLLTELREGNGKLEVFEYDSPASVRGILIDDKVLAIGFYTYETLLVRESKYPDDRFTIWGHNVPGWILYDGSPAFSIFCKMFKDLVANYDAWNETSGRKAVLRVP